MITFNALTSVFVILYTSGIPFTHSSSLEYDSWVNIKLYHNFQPEQQPHFVERGNITIQSLRLGQANVYQNPLGQEEQEQLRKLAKNNGLYQLKAVVTGSDGKEQDFISTVKACMLAESELDDRLSVSLDYLGNVIGVTLIIASKSTCEGADVPLSKLKQFTTNVYVRHTENGPIPETAAYIQRIEREKEAKEKGEGKDNRSFLAKYWMYIVPVVVIMVISSATNPEAAGGAGGGGSR